MYSLEHGLCASARVAGVGSDSPPCHRCDRAGGQLGAYRLFGFDHEFHAIQQFEQRGKLIGINVGILRKSMQFLNFGSSQHDRSHGSIHQEL